MFVRLLLLLTLIPIAELFVLLSVHHALADHFGFGTSLVITGGSILATGILGAALARSQGLGVLQKLQRSMAAGQFPAREIVDGVMVLVGGAMLLTPGFLTDIFGFTLLLPATRKLYRGALNAWLSRSIRRGQTQVRFHSDLGPAADPPPRQDSSAPRARVIDVTPEDQESPNS